MSGAEAFFDTSVLIYLLAGDADKANRVRELLLQRNSINVQVLNELSAVILRKRALTPPELREFLSDVRELCVTHSVNVDTHELGLEIFEKYGFSLYDSMIVAAALRAGCRTLYCEDLQHGQVIDKRLTVINPFAAA
jgi:predicted nucleic acid-binding protein